MDNEECFPFTVDTLIQFDCGGGGLVLSTIILLCRGGGGNDRFLCVTDSHKVVSSTRHRERESNLTLTAIRTNCVGRCIKVLEVWLVMAFNATFNNISDIS